MGDLTNGRITALAVVLSIGGVASAGSCACTSKAVGEEEVVLQIARTYCNEPWLKKYKKRCFLSVDGKDAPEGLLERLRAEGLPAYPGSKHRPPSADEIKKMVRQKRWYRNSKETIAGTNGILIDVKQLKWTTVKHVSATVETWVTVMWGREVVHQLRRVGGEWKIDKGRENWVS